MALRYNISFTKMESGGNDFIVINNRKKRLPGNPSKLAIDLCRRRSSIGADGLILLEEARKADYRMRIFNPDGSEPEMCGNGVRCLAWFAFVNGIGSQRAFIETRAGIVEAWLRNSNVKVKLSKPSDMDLDFRISIKPGASQKVNFINTGVPHAVVFVSQLERVDVESLGRIIRYHSRFSPSGTNVNFVKVEGRNSISIRTYERGVEAETLACGTGAVASALISALQGRVSPPVKVHTRGGEILKVDYKMEKDRQGEGNFESVWLEGKVRVVYEGTIGV